MWNGKKAKVFSFWQGEGGLHLEQQWWWWWHHESDMLLCPPCSNDFPHANLTQQQIKVPTHPRKGFKTDPKSWKNSNFFLNPRIFWFHFHFFAHRKKGFLVDLSILWPCVRRKNNYFLHFGSVLWPKCFCWMMYIKERWIFPIRKQNKVACQHQSCTLTLLSQIVWVSYLISYVSSSSLSICLHCCYKQVWGQPCWPIG